MGQTVAVSQHGAGLGSRRVEIQANVRQAEGDGMSEAGVDTSYRRLWRTGAQTPNRGGCRCVAMLRCWTLYGIVCRELWSATLRLKVTRQNSGVIFADNSQLGKDDISHTSSWRCAVAISL